MTIRTLKIDSMSIAALVVFIAYLLLPLIN